VGNAAALLPKRYGPLFDLAVAEDEKPRVVVRNGARRVANQTATIVSYQQIIISNQQKLDQVLTNQAKILAIQEQHVIANAERILANDEVMLAGL
jgi:hypothetical protein